MDTLFGGMRNRWDLYYYYSEPVNTRPDNLSLGFKVPCISTLDEAGAAASYTVRTCHISGNFHFPTRHSKRIRAMYRWRQPHLGRILLPPTLNLRHFPGLPCTYLRHRLDVSVDLEAPSHFTSNIKEHYERMRLFICPFSPGGNRNR